MHMYDFQFPVTISHEDSAFIVTLDDPKGRFQGADVAESEKAALTAAVSLLDGVIADAIKNDDPIPDPAELSRGTHNVSPSPQALAKLALYREFKEQKLTKAELGRRLGWKDPQVARLFDVRHASKLEQLAAAAEVMGRRFVIGMDGAC